MCRRPDSKHVAYSQCNNAFNGALWPLDIQLNQEAAFYLAWRTLTRDMDLTGFTLYKDSRDADIISQQPADIRVSRTRNGS